VSRFYHHDDKNRRRHEQTLRVISVTALVRFYHEKTGVENVGEPAVLRRRCGWRGVQHGRPPRQTSPDDEQGKGVVRALVRHAVAVQHAGYDARHTHDEDRCTHTMSQAFRAVHNHDRLFHDLRVIFRNAAHRHAARACCRLRAASTR
jgi:hypothetical protein